MADDEEHVTAARGEAPKPKIVLYCGVCGLPPEFCEFGPDFEKCKPWLREHSPSTYPELLNATEAGVENLSIRDGGGQAADGGAGHAAGGAGAAAAAAPAAEGAAPAKPGKKKKGQDKTEILVEKITRSKRKSVTVIKGLENFGVKLPDAAKKLGKKFACGASVTKGPTEKDQIDVQGDIIIDVADFITETWSDVPQKAIFLIEDGRKVPAY